MESRMLRNVRVRFGGWAGETHQSRGWQSAPVQPLLGVPYDLDFSHRYIGYHHEAREPCGCLQVLIADYLDAGAEAK